MPLRPIDMQVIIPRVQQFKQARETVVNKQANLLQQQQKTNIQETDRKMKQTNRKDEKQHGKIRDEEQSASKKRENRKRKKKKEKDDDSKKEEKQSLGYHRFDMKV